MDNKYIENRYTSLSVPAGKTEYGFALKLPFTGTIKRLVVKQTGGAPTTATVTIYSGRVIETSEGPPTITDPKELFQIIPNQNISAGNAMFMITDNDGYGYANTTNGFAVPDRRLYIAFSGSGIPNTTWAVSLTIRTY